MKKFIKIAVFVLVITALICCASCDNNVNEIVGKWETKIPHTVLAANQDKGNEPYMDYVNFENVYKRQVYEFDEDGVYKMTVYVDEYIDLYKEAVYEGIRQYYISEIQTNNLDSTVEELFERDGITKESITLDDKAMERLQKEKYSEGNYLIGQGRLYRSASKEYDVDESIYMEYEITNGNLVFKNQIGGNVVAFSTLFPLLFKKIG